MQKDTSEVAKEPIMNTSEYRTPFAKVHVYKNGAQIEFNIEPFDYGMYLNDDCYKKPEGIYKITVDMNLLQCGDVLVCEFDRGCLQDDGGDECTLNIVGTIGNYTVGMGTYDTQDIHKAHRLSYQVLGCTNSGFRVHIVNDPKKYWNGQPFQQICFIIAWEPETTDTAWDLISCVTC